MTSQTFADGSSYAFEYDAKGNRTLEKHFASNGVVAIHERDLEYDELNRLVTNRDAALGQTITYTYDANGNRATMTLGTQVTSYQYDAENRLVQVTDPDGDLTQLRYDADGNRTALILGNGVVASYTYDDDNRPTSITYTAPNGQVLQSFTYNLDAVGNRLGKKFANGTSDAYAYDVGNRLDGVSSASGDSRSYLLDAEGNFRNYTDSYSPTNVYDSTSTFNTTNSFNQLTQHVLQSNTATIPSVTATLSYDANGNQVQESDSPTNAVTTYTYDLDHRMVAATQTGSASPFSGSYVYDANGLRVAKLDSSGHTQYLLDGPTALAEDDPDGNQKEFHVVNPQRIDEQFAMTFLSGGAPTKVWPIIDALGSIYAWVDRSGNVGDSYSFDVYGARTQLTATDSIAWGFAGGEHDLGTGFDHFGDRYLNPTLGTWMQADRLGMDGDGPNYYGYVLQNPTNATDPSGQFGIVTQQFQADYATYLIEIVATNWDLFGVTVPCYLATAAATYGVDLGVLVQNVGVAAISNNINVDYVGSPWCCRSSWLMVLSTS